MSEYGIVLFFTTSSAMQAEKLLKKECYIVKLVPTPRQFSSDCGIALRFAWEHNETVLTALESARVEYDAVYRLA